MNKEAKDLEKRCSYQFQSVTPSVYVAEDKEGYVITYEIPGVGKEDVDLNVENRTLMLRTDNKFSPPADFKCMAREFPVCNYAVSLDLPEQADPTSIKAKVANGILTVKLPKRAELQPRKIAISQ